MSSTVTSLNGNASCLSEIPGIKNAVKNLTKIEQRMQNDDFGFNSEDISHVSHVIMALHKSYDECKLIHEKYEIETIQSSILRYQLISMPGDIRKLIKDAVESARSKDAEEETELKEQLKVVLQNIADKKIQLQIHQDENKKLVPERDRIRLEHEKIVSQLNQRMAEKADKQIILNETRDNVRETNQKIGDLEESILQLKEDLIQEKAEARTEKKRLKKSVFDTSNKIKSQIESNITMKEEMDVACEYSIEADFKMNSMKASIAESESKIENFLREEKELQNRFELDVKNIEKLKKDGIKAQQDTVKNEEEFLITKDSLLAKMAKIDELLNFQLDKNEYLSSEYSKASAIFEETETARNSILDYVKSENVELQECKEQLSKMAEEISICLSGAASKLQQVEELKDTHESIIEGYRNRIDEYKDQLNKERKERVIMQEKKEYEIASMQNLKDETEMLMKEMNDQIEKDKIRHDALTKEGINLKKLIEDEGKIKNKLEIDLAIHQDAYDTLRDTRLTEVEDLKIENKNMGIEIDTKKKLVNDRTKPFMDLINEFKSTTESFHERKKLLVSLKTNKLKSLENIKKAQDNLLCLDIPLTKTNIELKDKRALYIDILKSNGKEIQDIETDIYNSDCKLKNIQYENDKLLNANSCFEKQINIINEKLLYNQNSKQITIEKMTQLRELLEIKWNEEGIMEQMFADRDMQILKKFDNLIDHTEARKSLISDISNKLKCELCCLSDFLDNVSSRRPKDSRQSIYAETPMKEICGESEIKKKEKTLLTTKSVTFENFN